MATFRFLGRPPLRHTLHSCPPALTGGRVVGRRVGTPIVAGEGVSPRVTGATAEHPQIF